jgi:putative SOS response-associated peptidase YedK
MRSATFISDGGSPEFTFITWVPGLSVRDSRVHNSPPRWNGAPSQELLVIRRNHKTGEVTLHPLRWGLILYWCNDPKGGRKPINAKRETVRDLLTFRDAYCKRRCIVPVDGAVKGLNAKQPYAIAMKDGAPFSLAGIWENWREPASGEWIRTFAIITADSNELVCQIHDRMPGHPAAGRLRALAGRRVLPAPLDAAVPGQPHAHLAHLDAGQQAGEQRPRDCRARTNWQRIRHKVR